MLKSIDFKIFKLFYLQ